MDIGKQHIYEKVFYADVQTLANTFQRVQGWILNAALNMFSVKKAKDQPESEPAELASLVGERIRKIRKEEGLSLELFALSHQ